MWRRTDRARLSSSCWNISGVTRAERMTAMRSSSRPRSTPDSKTPSARAIFLGLPGPIPAYTSVTEIAVEKVSVRTARMGTAERLSPSRRRSTWGAGRNPPVRTIPATRGYDEAASASSVPTVMSARSPGVMTRLPSSRWSRKWGSSIAATLKCSTSPSSRCGSPCSISAPSASRISPTVGLSRRGSAGRMNTGGSPGSPARSPAAASAAASGATRLTTTASRSHFFSARESASTRTASATSPADRPCPAMTASSGAPRFRATSTLNSNSSAVCRAR